MSRRTSLAFEIVFGVTAAFAVWPLWSVDHPPIQDLPQHLATIRILSDYGDPALQFQRYFDIDLLRTQYLTWYGAAYLLSFVFDVELANRLLLSIAIAAVPYSARTLLRALGRDERAASLVFPLTWNAQLLLGFFNFIAAIPMMLVSIAWAVQLRVEWSRRRAVLLSALFLLTFYTHVVPFAVACAASVAVSLGDSIRRTAGRLATLVPAAVAALVWSRFTPAGAVSSDVLAAISLSGTPFGELLREAPSWLTDILSVDVDDKLLVGYVAVLVASAALSAARAAGEGAPTPDEVLRGALVWRLAWLAPLLWCAYFVMPDGVDFIWPIRGRFPLLAGILFVALVPWPRRLGGSLLVAAALALSVAQSTQVARAFVAYEVDEVGELDEAVAAIPKGSRVAGLVFERHSAHVRFSPFLHAAAWYQARRGGVAMFSFADFPQSPVRFRESNRPPRVGPRWEWMPERVDPVSDLAWYDYVLVRGGPARIARHRDVFRPVYRGTRWSVWRRERDAGGS